MVQIYTGNGKGKTTAAVGLAVRAVGAGMGVYMAQFVKGADSAEAAPLRAAGVGVEQFGQGMIIGRSPDDTDRAAAMRGIDAARTRLIEGSSGLVIMDEITVAIALGLVNLDLVLELVELCPAEQELVLTGRNAPAPLVNRAHLVTEMREIKHYFSAGTAARLGVEY